MTIDPAKQFLDVARLDHLVQTRPADALEEARAWLRDRPDKSIVDAQAWSVASRALFELGQMDQAVAAVRQALAICADHRGDEAALQVALSSTAILAEFGQLDESLAELDRVEQALPTSAHGRVAVQRAYVLHHAGRLHDALEHARRAEPLFVASGDDLGRLRLFVNRGVIELQCGLLDEAVADFRRADELAEQLGQHAMQAGIATNMGVCLGRLRRLRDALVYFDRAREIHAAVGRPGRAVALTEIDRAEVLMHAGLVNDAVDAAQLAVRHMQGAGNLAPLGDSRLLLARVLLAAGQVRAAVKAAEAAAATFEQCGRNDMVVHARAARDHASLAAAGDAVRCTDALRESGATVDALRSLGWSDAADELVLARVRSAHRCDAIDGARADLEALRLGAFSGRRDTALAGWFAESIARRDAGDLPGARSASTTGLDFVDDIVAEATSLEQRSAAMRLGQDLSQLTIDVAIEQCDADTVLAAAEGTRARALHDELVEQRPHHPLSEDGARTLRSDLAQRLGDRLLVEWVVSRGAVWAVVFGGGVTRLVEVASIRSVQRARDRVIAWLDRAAAEPDASSEHALHAAELLDHTIVQPLGLPSGVAVVMVPVGLLHGIPWSGLPGLSERSVTLVPSGQLWLRALQRSEPAPGPVGPVVGPVAGRVVGRVVGPAVGLVVGPDLPHASTERSVVATLYSAPAIARGADATPATVCSMLAELDCVHIAAHGRFRSDHPLLSTLRLHDGESTLYDALPELVRARLVVLSSCEGGAQGTADGSEVLGLASIMLARGAASVLAPLTTVRDLECADFVAEVHAELAAHSPIGVAVAAVRHRWLGDDDLSRWAVASSFTCFGADSTTIGA